MLNTVTLQMTQRGEIILPKALRDEYNLKPGDNFTLLDLGGVFVLSPRQSQVDALAERVTRRLSEKGETQESMLRALREVRKQYRDPE
ncbi:MAG: AbrB/MazE/SpoVT family DNA-binding domain-containing protein [Anaerolineales bacterium]